MTIYKIQFSNNGTIIIYKQDDGTKITLETDDLPLENFEVVVKSLKPYLAKICELPQDDIVVRGLTFSYKKDKPFITIVGSKPVGLSNSPFNIATPNIPCDEESLKQIGKVLEGLFQILNEIRDYTVLFIDGNWRKQKKLFKEPKEKKGKTDEEDD